MRSRSIMRTQKRKRVKINTFSGGVNYFLDESTLSPSYARDCYNFDFNSGVLTTGYGLEDYQPFLGLNIRTLWLYKRYDADENAPDDRLLAVTDEGYLYEVRNKADATRVGSIVLEGEINFVNYRLYGVDVVIITSEKNGMFVYDGVSLPYKVENAPFVTSMTLHSERLFVTVSGEKNAVWFSDDLDPTNWDINLNGAGFIQMIDERGAINGVVDYAGYVYAFRDYGISRISGYGVQTEFSVSNLFVSGGRIYHGSIALCGDRIILLAEDGLYAFDGVSTTRIFKNLDGLIESGSYATALYAGGKYYLAFRRSRNGETVGCEADEYKNNALLIYETETGNYTLSRGMDIVKLTGVGDEVVAVTADGRAGVVSKCGAIFGEPLLKKWCVPESDLGEVERKCVRSLSLYCSCPLEITFKGDGKEKKIKLNKKPLVQKKRLSFWAHRIGAEITVTEKEAHISRPSFEFTV